MEDIINYGRFNIQECKKFINKYEMQKIEERKLTESPCLITPLNNDKYKRVIDYVDEAIFMRKELDKCEFSENINDYKKLNNRYKSNEAFLDIIKNNMDNGFTSPNNRERIIHYVENIFEVSKSVIEADKKAKQEVISKSIEKQIPTFDISVTCPIPKTNTDGCKCVITTNHPKKKVYHNKFEKSSSEFDEVDKIFEDMRLEGKCSENQDKVFCDLKGHVHH